MTHALECLDSLARQAAAVFRCGLGLVFVCAFFWSAVGCDRQLTAEETSFYERAEKIKVGVKIETVEQELGAPSRTLDAQAQCANKGGRKEWVYENFESARGRKPLRAGSFMFCANQDGVVVAIVGIVN